MIRCESEKGWGEEVILGLLANKTWWVRPLTEIKTRSEESGFGNRRDKARVMEMMDSVWGLEIKGPQRDSGRYWISTFVSPSIESSSS